MMAKLAVAVAIKGLLASVVRASVWTILRPAEITVASAVSVPGVAAATNRVWISIVAQMWPAGVTDITAAPIAVSMSVNGIAPWAIPLGLWCRSSRSRVAVARPSPFSIRNPRNSWSANEGVVVSSIDGEATHRSTRFVWTSLERSGRRSMMRRADRA